MSDCSDMASFQWHLKDLFQALNEFEERDLDRRANVAHFKEAEHPK
jgi:hypothetical protein